MAVLPKILNQWVFVCAYQCLQEFTLFALQKGEIS